MSLTIGSDDQFEALKNLLEDCEYDEVGLGEPAGADAPKALLAALFLQARSAPESRSVELLPNHGLELLRELGLVTGQGGEIRAEVLLYPLHGLHIVSDFPRGSGPGEFVFPAISMQTHEYISLLPSTPCGDLLEIGTGSGAAALIAGRLAERVRATDVSPRCLLFAEFNRRLNGADHVEVVESDVYDSLGDRTFDRIIAHPPYVPWIGEQEIYRHGGPDGEAVLRRLIAGLPDRLRPGGRLYCAAMGADTAEAPLEQRLRSMLGDTDGEFDIALAERETLRPLDFILPWSEGEKMSFEESWKLNEAFRERGIQQLVRCSLVVARRDPDGEPLTVRRKAGKGTAGADIEGLLEPHAGPGLLSGWDELRATKPKLTPWARLESAAAVDGDVWRPYATTLEVEAPFEFRTDCPAWAAAALARLDGRRTLEEALGSAELDIDTAEGFFGALFQAGVLRE